MHTKTLSDINGLSNLKLKGSKNHGFKPSIVDEMANNGVTLFDGEMTNNTIKLDNERKKADIRFDVSPESVKCFPP